MEITPVVIAGGSGTRLWPLSREFYPKQLISFSGGHTLLQDTIKRLEGLKERGVGVSPPVIVCNEDSRFLVKEQLELANYLPLAIILEPEGRNTAPALTLASSYVNENRPTNIMLVLPADHVVQDKEAFHNAILRGLELTKRGAIVTFGVKPVRVETGYGYIRRGDEIPSGVPGLPRADTVVEFVEKPDVVTAQKYLAAGNYLWNSGMFMIAPAVWLKEIQNYRPEIHQACTKALSEGKADEHFNRVNAEIFKGCPPVSIDYAVIEKVVMSRSGQLAVVDLDAGWSDIGTWPAIWNILPKDENGIAGRGDVFADEVKDSLLFSEDRFLAVIGLKEIIVIETSDAVLVANISNAQDIGKVVDWLKSQKRGEHVVHRRVYRPWGSYETIVAGDRYQVKRITVKPGASLSLQKHQYRAEHWVVVKGIAKVTRGEEVFTVREDESTYIPLGEVHRLENPGSLPLELIEVQSGDYLGEDDIVRLEDIYQRHSV